MFSRDAYFLEGWLSSRDRMRSIHARTIVIIYDLKRNRRLGMAKGVEGSPDHRSFEAVIYKLGQLRCVDVPPEVTEALGGGARIPVKVRVNGVEDQTSLTPRKQGGHRLFLAAGLRRSAGVDTGSRIRAELRPDACGGEPDLPEELIAALGRVAGGMEELLSRSPADRRQLVRWIDQVQGREARRRRIDKAVEMVLRGKPKKRPRR